MQPLFFATPAAWRQWLEAHHATAPELWVGFYKVGSGHPSITWPESVGEALCFGWIDGVRRRLDEGRYVIRFTPRKRRSTWSQVNLERAADLVARERMHPAGLAAYEARDEKKSGLYSYERKKGEALRGRYAAELKANRQAWAFFQAQPPSYRRTASWWVMSAKQETTRLRRLATLIADSANRRRIPQLAPAKKPG